MNRVVLIQLTDFGLSSKQRCPASRQVPLDPLGALGLAAGMSNPNKWQASRMVLPRISTAREAIISHPGNDRVPRLALDLTPRPD